MRFILPIAIVSLLLFGCAKEEPQVPVNVRAADVPFSGESVMGNLISEEYRYFRYESVEKALIDKTKVAPDGQIIDGEEFMWEGPVHFYHLAKRIVIYIGDTPEVIEQIEKIFGPQFAGA
jgi:hypothetical protein